MMQRKTFNRTSLQNAPSARQLAEQRRIVMQRAVERLKTEARASSVITPQMTWSIPKPPPGVIPQNVSMAMDDAIDNYATWAMQHSAFAEGQMFLGYPYLAELSQRPEYRVISETWAQEMTRKWIRLVSTGDTSLDDKSDKLKVIEAKMKALKVKECFQKCTEIDGFFGRAQIYIDLGVDTQDRDELKSPIGNGQSRISKWKIRKGSLKHLRVIEPIWTYPNAYNANDPLKPDFFKPSTWFVMGQEIHSSRLLTFVGRPMPDLLKPMYSFGGLSLSQMAKPYIDNWLRTRQSVSDAISNFSIMMLLTDMASMMNENATTDLITRADFFNITRDNRGLMLADKDTEDLKNVSMPLSGLDHLQAQSQEHMSSVSQIPLVKLTGVSPSGLNATSEYEVGVFYDKVEAQQVAYFTENLSTILNIVQLDLYGEIDPEIGFTFEPLEGLDPAEEATRRKTEADTDIEYINAGVISPLESRTRLASDEDSPYASLDTSPEALPEPPAQPGQELDENGNSIGGAESPDAAAGGGEQTAGAVSQGNAKAKMQNRPVNSKPVAGAHDSAEFEESEHPRDKIGEFATKGNTEFFKWTKNKNPSKEFGGNMPEHELLSKLPNPKIMQVNDNMYMSVKTLPNGEYQLTYLPPWGGNRNEFFGISNNLTDLITKALSRVSRSDKTINQLKNKKYENSLLGRLQKEFGDVFSQAHSTQSNSEYLIHNPSGIKIRIADHSLPLHYEQPDVDLRKDQSVDEMLEIIKKEIIGNTTEHDIAMDFNPNHSPEDGEFAKGTGEVSGRKNVSSKGLPVDSDGNVTLTHYSNRQGITALNPHMYGSGLRGAESKRMQADPKNWVSRSYHGISGYKKEAGLGNIKYTSKLPADKLYDFYADPDHLRKKDVGEEANETNVYEKAIKKAGYAGYYVNNPQFGGIVAATFNSLPVTQAHDYNPNHDPKDGEFTTGGGSNKSIPKEPGSTPVKPGYVRLYHQTDEDSLKQIEKEGLKLEHAKGIEGPRAIYAGETPFYGKADSRPTLEFQVPKDQWDAPFVLRDITPDDFIGVHYPWHSKARYIEAEGNEQILKEALAGKFDNLDGDYKKAVDYIKQKYSKPAHDAEWNESEHPRGQPENAGEFASKGTATGNKIMEGAKAFAALPKEKIENFTWEDIHKHVPDHGHDAYILYEAQKLLPKPSDKLKRVTENNTWAAWQEQDYLANVDGVHFVVTKQEDPDADEDDEDKFIYAYERLDDPDHKLITTSTSDKEELFKELHKAATSVAKEPEQPVIKLSGKGDKEANAKKLKPFFTDFLKAGFRNPLDDTEVIIGKAGVELHMTVEGNVHINFIRSLEQGGGHASKALDKVCELADKHNVTLDLEAAPMPNHVKDKKAAFSKKQLIEWYGRHGFKSVTKRGEHDHMVRVPQQKLTGDDWNESDHPRGQPENAGEFAPALHTDNPGGEWLQKHRQYGKEHGTNQYGVPNHFGPVTATFNHKPVIVPMNKLAQVPGQKDEQHNVRQNDLAWLKNYMGKLGHLPLMTNSQKEYVPFVMVDKDGKPWMNEGNHRVMAAQQLGWKHMPVEVRYFNGGEQAKGDWHPDTLLKDHAQLQSTQRTGTPGKYQKRPVTAGVKQGKVLFEIAPNPKDIESSSHWNALDETAKTAISSKVLADILPEVLQKTGVKAKMHLQYGGYLEDTNPSVSLVLDRNTTEQHADALTRILGAALEQDSMMRVAKKPFAGSTEMGAVVIKVPKNITYNAVKNLYNTLRGSIPEINGHTTDAGHMVILVDKAQADTIGRKVSQVLGDDYDVGFDTLNVAWPEKGEDNYGLQRQDRVGQGSTRSSTGDWLNSVRTKAINIRQQQVQQYEKGLQQAA